MTVIATIKTFFRYPPRRGVKSQADLAIAAWDEVVDELERDLKAYRNGEFKKTKPKGIKK